MATQNHDSRENLDPAAVAPRLAAAAELDAEQAAGLLRTALDERRSAQELIAACRPRLEEIRLAWELSLPPDHVDWPLAGVYLRESLARSLVAGAHETQLRGSLNLLGAQRYFVPPDGIFFDISSGTDFANRGDYKLLFERAMRGGFKAIGMYGSDRMFRNLGQSIDQSREFRKKGIEIIYTGVFQGDDRGPTAWLLQTMQHATNELHSRNVSFQVGTHFENMTRDGYPVGRIPAGYRSLGRGDSFMGRRGSIVGWELVQPLASIINEGRLRYVAGGSMQDLAQWSLTTELKGVAPKGRRMTAVWWRHTLQNPRYAGYQMPTEYHGFKPGKESPKRRREVIESELVPCQLPALWTLDDYREIMRVSRERWRGAKSRKKYESRLLTSIAYDARCGHRMDVSASARRGETGRYRMRCANHDQKGPHSSSVQAEVAAAELDQMIGSIRFDNPELQRQIEEELHALQAREQGALEQFQPNPQIGGFRRAVAALGGDAADLRSELLRRIADLEALDEDRRSGLRGPVFEFRQAMRDLRAWSEVWTKADVAHKNQLLREAGVRVTLGTLDGVERGPAHVLAIDAENDMFRLALAAALGVANRGLDAQTTHCSTNAYIRLLMSGQSVALLGRIGRVAQQGEAVLLDRPEVVTWFDGGRPNPAVGELTKDEFAARAGVPVKRISYLISEGRLPVTRKLGRKSGRVVLYESQLGPFLRGDRYYVGRPRTAA